MPPCATDRPVGTEFPNHLVVGEPCARSQRGPSPGEACRPLLLLGLMLLCLAPRALMAWKLDGVCPDGVAYIRLAELLDQGQGREFLRLAGVNPLPLALVALHRLGLDWEVAGSLWGVLMGAAVVLPLFGWLRRQFDRRVALAGCFLYAVHGELIRWSPEVLRDPTFWFLFTLGLYLLWRAVTEVRLGLFLSAAAAIVLASATRFEGLLLLVPLAGWSVARWRALRQGATSVPGATAGLPSSAGYTAGQANRADVTAGQASSGTRARLAIGALACLGAMPAVAVAALLLLGIRGHGAAELLHVRPLILAGGWLQFLAAPLWGDTSGSSPMLPKSLPPISFGRMWEIYVPTVVKGLTVLWTALWAVGAASRRGTHGSRFFMVAERPLPPGDRPGPAAGGDVGPSLGAALVVPALRVSRGLDGVGTGRPGAVARVGAGRGVLAVGRKSSTRHTPCAASPHTACAGCFRRGAGDRGRGRRAGGGVLLELQPAHGEGRAGPLAPRAARTVAGAVRSGRFHPGGQLLRAGAVCFLLADVRRGNGADVVCQVPAQRGVAATRRVAGLRPTGGPARGSGGTAAAGSRPIARRRLLGLAGVAVWMRSGETRPVPSGPVENGDRHRPGDRAGSKPWSRRRSQSPFSTADLDAGGS